MVGQLTKQLKLDPSLYEAMQKERVELFLVAWTKKNCILGFLMTNHGLSKLALSNFRCQTAVCQGEIGALDKPPLLSS